MTLDVDDYLHGTRRVLRRKVPPIAAAFLSIGIGAYVLLQFAIYGGALLTPYNLAVLAGGIAVFIGVMIIGLGAYYALAAPAIARRAFARMPFSRVPTTYRFDEDGLHTRNAHGSDDLPWEMLGEVYASRHVLLIDRGPNEAFTIPRDQLSPEVDRALFDLLRRHDLWKGSRP